MPLVTYNDTISHYEVTHQHCGLWMALQIMAYLRSLYFTLC